MQAVRYINEAIIAVEGSQLLQAAIEYDEPSIVDHLLSRQGVNVLEPPTTICLLQEEKIHNERVGVPGYIKRPFIILAARVGNLQIFKMLVDAGCNL